MALSSETDPVEALRLILDPSEGNLVTGFTTDPTHVEQLQETDRETKLNRVHNAGTLALYVWSPTSGEFPQFDAEWDYQDIQIVQVEAWAPSGSGASTLAGEVRTELFKNWVRDNKSSTAWNEIVPINEDDARGSTPAGKGNKAFIVNEQVRLGRLVEP